MLLALDDTAFHLVGAGACQVRFDDGTGGSAGAAKAEGRTIASRAPSHRRRKGLRVFMRPV